MTHISCLTYQVVVWKLILGYNYFDGLAIHTAISSCQLVLFQTHHLRVNSFPSMDFLFTLLKFICGLMNSLDSFHSCWPFHGTVFFNISVLISSVMRYWVFALANGWLFYEGGTHIWYIKDQDLKLLQSVGLSFIYGS